MLLALLIGPAQLRAQDEGATTQLWANLTLGIPGSSPKWVYEIDFEPKMQVEGPENWVGITLNTRADFQPIHWLDLTGDLSVDYTVQSDDLQTFMVAPRIGALLHILSNIREQGFVAEKVKRLGMATFLRLEYRSFWYTGDAAEESHDASWRFRIRYDIRFGLNRADRSLPGTWYLFADAEAFINLGDPAQEAFNSRWRVRVGPGYRLNRGWRFEVLYMFEDTRNTLEGGFERSNNAIDLRAGYNY